MHLYVQIQDQASQEDKMNILVQLFWICIAILESDARPVRLKLWGVEGVIV